MKLRLTTRVCGAALLMWMAVMPYPRAFAATAQTRHRYEITGGLTASTDSMASSAPNHFGAIKRQITVAGEGFVLSARLAATPNACSADTIFTDGFDP